MPYKRSQSVTLLVREKYVEGKTFRFLDFGQPGGEGSNCTRKNLQTDGGLVQ